MNRDTLIALLERRGKILLALTALLMVAAIVGIVQLRINTEFEVFMPPDSASRRALESMADRFGDAEQLIVLAEVPTDDDLFALPAIAARLERAPGVVVAEPPMTAEIASMAPDERGEALDRLERLAGGTGIVTHEGVRYATVRVLLASDARAGQVVDEVEAAFGDAGIPATVSGEPYLQAAVFRYILRILLTIPPVIIVLMLGVFRLRLGSMRATVLSLVPAIVGAALTLGGIAWIEGTVSIVSVLVPIFVIVLGSADGLHMTSHVMDALAEGSDNRTAVSSTLAAVGVPVIMTTLTTMAGFLSLTLINSAAIRQLGVAAAVGVVVAGAATWMILPTILLHQKPLASSRRKRSSSVVGLLEKLRGWRSIVLAVALLAVFVPGTLRLRASFSMIDMYKERTEVRQSIEKAAEVLGGSIPVYLTFPADDGLEPGIARAVLEMQDRTADEGIAGRSLSAYSVIRSVWKESSGHKGYPPNAALARTMGVRIRRTNDEFLQSFFSGDGVGRAVFFLRDLDDATLESFLALAEEVGAEHGVDLQPVGTAFVMKEMNDQIIPQQIWSLLLATGLVLLLTTITQRSLALGLAAVVPILITLVTLFGVMGYARIDLSIVTGIMTGLTVGVGIDYAIHYVSMLRLARRTGEPDPAGSALRYVATPVLANALGLAAGFTAMLFSPLQIHETLTILMWTTMVTSAVLSLTLLPTITGSRARGSSGGGESFSRTPSAATIEARDADERP